MEAQERKLLSTLSMAVKALDRLDDILPTVESLGRLHVVYGVEDRHYDTVGTALVAVLEEVLGEAYTPPIHGAWLACYGLLAEVMRAAARTMRHPTG
jgi:hemoglobin-like flavoprotein